MVQISLSFFLHFSSRAGRYTQTVHLIINISILDVVMLPADWMDLVNHQVIHDSSIYESRHKCQASKACHMNIQVNTNDIKVNLVFANWLFTYSNYQYPNWFFLLKFNQRESTVVNFIYIKFLHLEKMTQLLTP